MFICVTWIGVVFAHLCMDSLTMTGDPFSAKGAGGLPFSAESSEPTPPGEFVLTGIIAFVAFIVFGSFSLDTERRNCQEIYRKGIADRKEYS